MRTPSSQRGSALLVVLVLTTLAAVVAGSFLTYTLSERQLNQRSLLRYESKNAAEALLEFGASELSVRFQANANFSTSALPDQPVTVHQNRFGSLFSDSNGPRWTHVAADNVTLWASQTSERARRHIDPSHPENDYDPLRGQRVSSQSVRLLAQATARHPGGTSATTYATQLFEIREAALFNYAIFYNIPLEFHPSPKMTINGPVHSNSTIHLTEGGKLTFNGTFSTAASFTAGATTAGRPSGRRISFATGLSEAAGDETVSIDQPIVEGQRLNTYVDSFLSQRIPTRNFGDVSSQLWRGYVQDSSHGVMPQNPPGVFTPEQARELILPPGSASSPTIEAQKFSTQAGLYFFVEANNKGRVIAFFDPADAAAFRSAGDTTARNTWLAANPTKVLTPPTGLITTKRRMRDMREKQWVNTVDLNLGVLRNAVVNPTSSTGFKVGGTLWAIDDATNGWNGIVYFEVENPLLGWTDRSDVPGMTSADGTGTRTAIRLVNASRLPSRGVDTAGLTIATNAAVYLVGHYNADGALKSDLSDMTTPESTEEVPAAVVADAVNILSQAWWDSDTNKPVGDYKSNDSTRPDAAHTEVSCAFLTGIVATSGGTNANYSGGVENYPRFHEDWSDRSLRYRGSIVALFTSNVAKGIWSDAKYDPPKREWGFNQMFADGKYPPGTPRLRTYRRLDYRDLTQAEFETLRADTRLAFMEM